MTTPPPEPYYDYEVVTAPPAPDVHLRVTAQATADGVCLCWEGDAEGMTAGSLGEAGAILLHAIGALLGLPQPAPPSDDKTPRYTR